MNDLNLHTEVENQTFSKNNYGHWPYYSNVQE